MNNRKYEQDNFEGDKTTTQETKCIILFCAEASKKHECLFIAILWYYRDIFNNYNMTLSTTFSNIDLVTVGEWNFDDF